MNNSILILGDSGTGKSSSIRTLPPEQTFIVNVVGKTLPFRGSARSYTKLSPDGMTGNFYCNDDAAQIKRVIKTVNDKRPEIKYLILDDLGYVAMNAFMRRALLKGYDRFSEIASEFNTAIELVNQLRDDLYCFVTMHIETDKQGKTKPKTIGNMVDQYINIEGKFALILHTTVSEGNYKFITNNDGTHMAKSLMGLFDKNLIDNDLLYVANKLEGYLNEDIA
jgi:hypothetical protein